MRAGAVSLPDRNKPSAPNTGSQNIYSSCTIHALALLKSSYATLLGMTMTYTQLEAGQSPEIEYELQLSDARNALWVHSCQDGSTVARFGRMGIDLHNTVTEQLAGMPECRYCTHGKPTVADWAMFRQRVAEWFGVDVPADAFDPKLLNP